MARSAFGLRTSSLLLGASALTLTSITSCTPKPEAAGPISAMGEACADPAAFPKDFDYPLDKATVEKWVERGDLKAARRHGWYLWAGLNVPNSDIPTWRSWCTSTQAFAAASPSPSPSPSPTPSPSPSPSASGSPVGEGQPITRSASTKAPMRNTKQMLGADPINFPVQPHYWLPKAVMDKYAGTGCINANDQLVDGPNFQNNGDIMVAGVIYDNTAYNWIRSQGLYLTSTLNPLIPSGTATAQMPAMPNTSIVLKPMMWPVKKDGYTALPIWDGQTSDNDAYAGYEIQTKWPRAMAVTTKPGQPAPSEVSFLYNVTMGPASLKPPGIGEGLGPNVYKNPAVVSTDQFYRFRPDIAKLAPCDNAILDASAWWAYGRLFEPGDELIVVAMHILTKEQPAWTFQSVWWHDKPDEGPYAADRPDIPAEKAPGPWRHYLMTSTYGITSETNANQWPVAYNPYIELAAGHPIETNCMNCHHRAAYPAGVNGYLAPNGPGALDVFAYDNNRIFYGLVGVDSMWAINDRAVGPRPTPSPTPTPSPSPTGSQ